MALLIDGHCHPVLATDLDLAAFEQWCTEATGPAAPGTSYLDSQVGLAVRRWCPPVLGLPPHATPAEYLARRAEVGWQAASAALLHGAGLSDLLVDTGLRDGLVMLDGLGELAGARAHEVVRLEVLAEDVARTVDAATFAEAYRSTLADRVRSAAAVKSIVAYRYGLAIPAERPTPAEVRRAAREWFAGGAGRLTHPVLLRFVLWSGVDTGLPIQLHTGFGDRDLSLRHADPALLQPFLAAVEPLGVPVVLLHCYPYHRQAGWLALVYPHVYVDVGLTLTHLGTGAERVLAEFLDLVPFGKVLFSTDGYALPELHYVGASAFRSAWAALAPAFGADAERIGGLIGAGNARRVYRLPA